MCVNLYSIAPQLKPFLTQETYTLILRQGVAVYFPDANTLAQEPRHSPRGASRAEARDAASGGRQVHEDQKDRMATAPLQMPLPMWMQEKARPIDTVP